MVLCRGVFYVTVHEAHNLPDRKTLLSQASSWVSGLFGQKEKADYVSCRVKVRVGSITIGKTASIDDDENRSPVWGECFRSDVAVEASSLTIGLYAAEAIQKDCMATLALHLKDIMARPDEPQTWKILSLKNEETSDDPEWFPLADSKGKKVKGAKIKISVRFEPPRESPEVPGVYFGLKTGNRVTLYQDAETPPNDLYDLITYEDDVTYQPPSAWRDIHKALELAKVLIYFTGWSVWAKLVMVRDEEGGETLGELLKRKAEEGVTVLGLVWDEKTSNDVLPGLMGTHDEETHQYFKNTKVRVAMVSRQKSSGCAVGSQFSSTCYSHHQKSLIIDVPYSEDDEDRRRLVSYVGGLDLTSGRFDTPEHHLFKTLQSTHKNDFYQNCVKVNPSMGPRQPWHDLHCRIEGPIVYDVLKNFEERWVNQAKASLRGFLVNTSERDDVDKEFAYEGDNSWNCQLFRSITRDSAAFDSDKQPLLTKKAKTDCEDSIHTCYVHLIRQAKNFIYIENQYFLGSAYAWNKSEKPKAHHVIPFEITCKIVEKIQLGERFSAYVVLPMYPEGDPSSNVVQEILYWQRCTMQMMYTRIAQAIKKAGVDATPQDYLNFYCLGNREVELPDDLPEPPQQSVEEKLRRTRRFMIYVHSKMMLVDDTYVVIGSANINQRSMGGTRDTEIAVGAYQPNYVADSETLPSGAVQAYRKALWAEHTGSVDECYDNPGSLECMQKVNEVARSNWEKYASDELQPMSGFFLQYPVEIAEDGSIRSLPGSKHFPDTNASVLGCSSKLLPNQLTT